MSAAASPLHDGMVLGDDGLARPAWAAAAADLTAYYDHEWGMPVTSEQGVFERLCLEGFQAGLSWALILRRRQQLREAMLGFQPERLADMGEGDVERLLSAPGMIRHRGKIAAVLNNARATLALREQPGLGAAGALGPGADLADLVWSYRPAVTPAPRTQLEVPTQSVESAALARELKRRGFRFVGPTTMFALMEALGIVDTHLLGSHRRGSSGLWAADGTPRADPPCGDRALPAG